MIKVKRLKNESPSAENSRKVQEDAPNRQPPLRNQEEEKGSDNDFTLIKREFSFADSQLPHPGPEGGRNTFHP
jgi:hypothetical protein